VEEYMFILEQGIVVNILFLTSASPWNEKKKDKDNDKCKVACEAITWQPSEKVPQQGSLQLTRYLDYMYKKGVVPELSDTA
jgi:hypothetical protein